MPIICFQLKFRIWRKLWFSEISPLWSKCCRYCPPSILSQVDVDTAALTWAGADELFQDKWQKFFIAVVFLNRNIVVSTKASLQAPFSGRGKREMDPLVAKVNPFEATFRNLLQVKVLRNLKVRKTKLEKFWTTFSFLWFVLFSFGHISVSGITPLIYVIYLLLFLYFYGENDYFSVYILYI